MPRSNGSAALATHSSKDALAQLEQVVVAGNLATLSEQERIGYYARVCESLGLNPLTRPFEYITLNGRLTLYARKDATDQLRSLKGISVTNVQRRTDLETEGLYCIQVDGRDAKGRTDSAIAAVPIAGLKGENLANALMKCESKGKRRMTLSLAGLGWMDETEVETVTATVEVPSREDAVAARVAALESSDAETVLDVDDIPFETARPASGDPWMRRLHAVGAERGLAHEDLHELAAEQYGVESITDLSDTQRVSFMVTVQDIEQVADPSAPAGEAQAVDTRSAPGSPASPVIEQPTTSEPTHGRAGSSCPVVD